MKERILITGANGMIAKRLFELLEGNYDLRFLSRIKKQENEFVWDIKRNYIDEKALEGVHHIIHLSGSSIGGGYWTKERKQTIISSRVQSAHLLLRAVKERDLKLKTVISASAVGYYGTAPLDKEFTENDVKGEGFLSEVCEKWEESADNFLTEKFSERVIKLRIGIVLSKESGFWGALQKAVRYHLATSFGNGRQYIPWIHIDDICGICRFALENKNMSGVFNAVAPNPLTNRIFVKKVASLMKKKIYLPPIPSIILKLLLGEMSVLFLAGNRISSQKLQDKGYQYKYSDIDEALKNLIT